MQWADENRWSTGAITEVVDTQGGGDTKGHRRGRGGGNRAGKVTLPGNERDSMAGDGTSGRFRGSSGGAGNHDVRKKDIGVQDNSKGSVA